MGSGMDSGKIDQMDTPLPPYLQLALHTECVTELDYQSEMIIFGSILTTFE